MVTQERMPASKAELMSAIQNEWSLLMDMLMEFDSVRMVTADPDGWSPKDNLAHLTEWMKVLMGFYMDLRRAHDVLGVDPEVTQVWDFEARNQFLFERNRHRSVESVLDEFKSVYAELMARLNAMSFDDLMKPQHPFDPQRRPLLLYIVRGTSEHFAEHRERMQRFL
jgi:hypothetical protein